MFAALKLTFPCVLYTNTNYTHIDTYLSDFYIMIHINLNCKMNVNISQTFGSSLRMKNADKCEFS